MRDLAQAKKIHIPYKVEAFVYLKAELKVRKLRYKCKTDLKRRIRKANKR